jgi:hypothetical protein
MKMFRFHIVLLVISLFKRKEFMDFSFLFKRNWLFFFMLVLFMQTAHAQNTGKIEGFVTDAKTGEPLPGVNVIIPGSSMGAATDLEGHYYIINVPVGTYEVRASMVGYAAITKTNVLVTINQTTNIDFSLKMSVIEGEEVTVLAERDILHNEIAYSQEVVTSDQILAAPATRKLNDFLIRQAGVDEELGIRGGSADQTGLVLNGMTFVDQRHGEADGTVPLSGVEQLSVVKGGFNAEYGNFRSGMLEVTTRSGAKDRYTGRIDMSMNRPHMKYFGKSIYDPYNYMLRSHLDPTIAFVGTREALGENEYLQEQYRQFSGWNSYAQRYNRRKAPENQVTPLDLYLWDAWMHMVEPPFEKLAQLGYEVPNDLQKVMREHAHPDPSAENPDWNVDFGFGGPVPVLGDKLGNATFYLSHNSNEEYYIVPVSKESVIKNTTMLTISSELTADMKLKINSLYQDRSGVLSAGKPGLMEPGFDMLMPADNLRDREAGEFTVGDRKWSGELYMYDPNFFTPMKDYTTLIGTELTHSLSPSTFYTVTLSREDRWTRTEPEWQKYITVEEFHADVDPQEYLRLSPRSEHAIAEFGPIKVNEMPYYWSPGNTVVDGFEHDLDFEAPFGITDHRFARDGMAWIDSTTTVTYRLRFDISSQLNAHHFIKSGIRFTYSDFNHKQESHRYDSSGGYQSFLYRRFPKNAAFYIQDQMTYQGVVANIGLRADYYDLGGNWPQADPFDAKVWGDRGKDKDFVGLSEFTVWNKLGVMKEVDTHLTLSPRLGFSFPVTDRSKFYFNYGHFRSLVPWRRMFVVRSKTLSKGIKEIGDPNMEAPRTISYETGVEYNLADQFLIRLSGYYKDITGQHAYISYESSDGELKYNSYGNNNYQDILGAELSITKSVGKWITGWANLDFYYKKSGMIGRKAFFEDPSREEEEQLYQGQESSFLPQPSARANITFHAPQNLGPGIQGFHPFGGWLLSLLPTWQSGSYFTFHPINPYIEDNLQWPDYVSVDLRLRKQIKFKGMTVEPYLDISNVFNRKQSLFHRHHGFEGEADYYSYLASLHLPIYDSPEFDELRQANPGLYQPGDDQPGDLRSDDKPHINDPNGAMWLFDQPRDIWFGFIVQF